MGEAKIDQNSNIRVLSTSEGGNASPKTSRRVKVAVGVILSLGLLFKPVENLIVDILIYEKTDDAQIAGNLLFVSARVGGVVSKINFEDNSVVKKGDVLLQLDQREFEVKVSQLQSELNIALSKFETAKRDLGRATMAPNTVFMEIAQSTYREVLNVYWIARSKLDQASLDLEYSTIRAPYDGKVGKREVELGSILRPFQSVTTLLGAKGRWITANFKETQLGDIRVGQEVEIQVDSINGKLFKGKVESISPASGASVALIPPDNATGNFTKIVQRVPIKIAFDPGSIAGFEDRLIPGSSVVARVKSSQ